MYIMNSTGNITDMFINDIATSIGYKYTTIVLSALFFVSEVLPFLTEKLKSKGEILDLDLEGNGITIKPKTSLLHDTNGIFHSLLTIYNKYSKK